MSPPASCLVKKEKKVNNDASNIQTHFDLPVPLKINCNIKAMEISPYTMAVWLYQGQKLKKEKVMEYNKTAVALTTGITETVINICRKINPEMILMNACAFTRVINCAPNILKKIAGITQYIPPNGIPKSRKGSCPSLILYAPSHDKKILTL